MIQLYCGNDTTTVRSEAQTYIDSAKERGVSVARIEADSYAPGVLAEALGATSLFGEETLYVIDTPSALADFAAEVTDSLAALGESGNTFVVIEEALLAPVKKKYEKAGATINEYKKAAAERFNTFAMADALARKDKRNLWVLLQGARGAGISAEEVIGILWWQLKSLRLASVTQTAGEAGMKDFPYKKAKGALRNFKDGEVVALSSSLLAVYHDGHGGSRDINHALEQWCLTL